MFQLEKEIFKEEFEDIGEFADLDWISVGAVEELGKEEKYKLD